MCLRTKNLALILVSRRVVHEGGVAIVAEEMVRMPEVTHRFQTTLNKVHLEGATYKITIRGILRSSKVNFD